MGAYDLKGKLVASQVVDNINKNIKDATALATIKEETLESVFPVKVSYNNGHKYRVMEEGEVVGTLEAGDTAPSDSNATYISGDYTVVIPADFTVSATESLVENGLVVTDRSNNEWVWIPVNDDDFLAMFETASNDGWTMNGTSVKTKYKTSVTTLGSRALNRTNPGVTSYPYYREPDVLSSYDTEKTLCAQAGFGDLVDMATKLNNEYKDMRESIKENKGFYVGRYELGKDASNNPQVKAGDVMNNTNWYNLYSACKSFSSGNVESRMIWGCQWDQVCRFIRTAKDTSNNTISLNNSTNYGNYSGSTDYKTGTRNNCITNNIYDLAGNCWEWTQEAYSVNYRAGRGRMVKTEMVLKVQFQVVVMNILISLIVFS